MAGKPYVYALVDPRSGDAFYVGKGQGRRMYEHENEALRQDCYVTNPEKRARIEAILAAGLRVKHQVLAEFECHGEAFEAERAAIARLPGLTNRNAGRRAAEAFTTPESTLAEMVQTLAQEIANTLSWKVGSLEAGLKREEHIGILNRAMAVACKLAAELAAPPRH